MIILDTNIISETLKSQPDATAIAWLDLQNPMDLYATAVTLAEMEFGHRSMRAGKQRKRLAKAIRGLFDEDFRDRTLPFDAEAARIYGRQMAAARSSGRAVSQFDGMIAAIALAKGGVPVATRDHAPFEAMGVATIDPWDSR